MGVWGGHFGVIFDLKCWKMFQMLNAAGIFSKSGISDPFFYKMSTSYFPSHFFKCAKTAFFVFFRIFSLFFIKNDHFWHFSNLRKWMRTILGHISPKMTKNVIFAKTVFRKSFFTKSIYRTFASLKNVKKWQKRHFYSFSLKTTKTRSSLLLGFWLFRDKKDDFLKLFFQGPFFSKKTTIEVSSFVKKVSFWDFLPQKEFAISWDHTKMVKFWWNLTHILTQFYQIWLKSGPKYDKNSQK